jgi:benzil reductase ((S)-benzoin forming)
MNKRAALVTGSSHGIGKELSLNLLNQGWIVFGTGRDIQSLNKIHECFSNFIAIQSDFNSNKDIENIASIIKASNIPLYLSVQNAGMKSPPRPLTEYNCESIDEVFNVNLLGPMKLTALLAAAMPAEARILYVTSRAAGLKIKESSTYCASKVGLDEVAAIVRQELAEKNIGITCVIPGEVDTHIQKILRETTGFHLHEMFQKAYEQQQLISPKICAKFLAWLLCQYPFQEFKNSKMPISIYDTWHHKEWLDTSDKLPAFPF